MVDKKQNEVTIELELKELIEENEQIIILLKYDGEVMKEITLRRRNNDWIRIKKYKRWRF